MDNFKKLAFEQKKLTPNVCENCIHWKEEEPGDYWGMCTVSDNSKEYDKECDVYVYCKKEPYGRY